MDFRPNGLQGDWLIQAKGVVKTAIEQLKKES